LAANAVYPKNDQLRIKAHSNGPTVILIDGHASHITLRVRKDQYTNIVLSGGSRMFEHLPEMNEKVIIRSDCRQRRSRSSPKSTVWIGESLLSSLIIARNENNDAVRGLTSRKSFSTSWDRIFREMAGVQCTVFVHDHSQRSAVSSMRDKCISSRSHVYHPFSN
jgi:hypothetical protein